MGQVINTNRWTRREKFPLQHIEKWTLPSILSFAGYIFGGSASMSINWQGIHYVSDICTTSSQQAIVPLAEWPGSCLQISGGGHRKEGGTICPGTFFFPGRMQGAQALARSAQCHGRVPSFRTTHSEWKNWNENQVLSSFLCVSYSGKFSQNMVF